MKPILANVILAVGSYAAFSIALNAWLLLPIFLILIAGALHGWDLNDQIKRGK